MGGRDEPGHDDLGLGWRMDELIEGYRRFRRETWPQEKARFEALSREGQRPKSLVIACSDSRVDPQMIFGAAPGELFVVRNVANLVPPYAPDAAYHGTSAAIEFAVRALKVEQVVVLGHAQCGGVRALLDGTPTDAREFVEPWIHIADAARARADKVSDPQARQELCEHETVRVSVANLLSFPWLRAAVEARTLTLHGCHFGVANGRLTRLGPDGAFHAV
jgi:carbonic anhydrase